MGLSIINQHFGGTLMETPISHPKFRKGPPGPAGPHPVLVGALHRPVPFKMLRRQGIQVTTLVVAVASLEFAGVQILERRGNTGDDHKKI